MNPFIQIPNRSTKDAVVTQETILSSTGVSIPAVTEKKVDTQEERYLSILDKLELQLALEKSKSSGLAVDAVTQRITALRAVIQNYELRIPQLKKDLENLTNELEEKKTAVVETGTSYATLRTELTKKYELAGRWDFDQETGKIKC